MNIPIENDREHLLRNPPTELAVFPTVKMYNSRQYNDLREVSERFATSTQLVLLERPEQILLSANGKTLEGAYRFSTLALKQFCSKVSSGLYNLLMDISGLYRKIGHTDAVVSNETAIQIFNACVKLRFRSDSVLMSQMLVVDSHSGIIEGVVGKGYKYLAHNTLCDLIDEAFKEFQSELLFFQATLIGRRLSLAYTAEYPAFKLDDGVKVSPGLYFNNSESGECGVHMADMLRLDLGELGQIKAISKLKHVSHSGRKFDTRVRKVIRQAIEKAPSNAKLESGLKRLKHINLGLEIKDGKITSWSGDFCRRISCRKIDEDVAKEVARWTMYAGGYGSLIPAAVDAKAIRGRNGYDLALSLMRIASNQHPRIREPMEQLAYDLITGRFDV